jgi:internalin A
VTGPNPGVRPVRVFVSYAHEDDTLREELMTHLALLVRQGLIAPWQDRSIRPGDEWEREIDENLEAADVVLLLVSPDFLASDYIDGKELARALERDAAGEARVVPVILRPADWESAPFGKLQAVPKDAKPVTTWANRDEAWADVVRSLRALTNG